MAGIATSKISLKVTGLGNSVELECTKVLTVPVEALHGPKTIVATAQTTAIQLFSMIDHIALAKIYHVYIKALSGTIYINVDTAGTATFAAAAADLVLNEGEACNLPINPDGNLGLAIDAASITDAFEWMILGEA